MEKTKANGNVYYQIIAHESNPLSQSVIYRHIDTDAKWRTFHKPHDVQGADALHFNRAMTCNFKC